jgi:hypothetical protein
MIALKLSGLLVNILKDPGAMEGKLKHTVLLEVLNTWTTDGGCVAVAGELAKAKSQLVQDWRKTNASRRIVTEEEREKMSLKAHV